MSPEVGCDDGKRESSVNRTTVKKRHKERSNSNEFIVTLPSEAIAASALRRLSWAT